MESYSNNHTDRDRFRLICHQCYEYDQISPKCPLQPSDLKQIDKNPDGLKPYEKSRVLETAYRVASLIITRISTNRVNTGTENQEQYNEENQGREPGDF